MVAALLPNLHYLLVDAHETHMTPALAHLYCGLGLRSGSGPDSLVQFTVFSVERLKQQELFVEARLVELLHGLVF